MIYTVYEYVVQMGNETGLIKIRFVLPRQLSIKCEAEQTDDEDLHEVP